MAHDYLLLRCRFSLLPLASAMTTRIMTTTSEAFCLSLQQPSPTSYPPDASPASRPTPAMPSSGQPTAPLCAAPLSRSPLFHASFQSLSMIPAACVLHTALGYHFAALSTAHRAKPNSKCTLIVLFRVSLWTMLCLQHIITVNSPHISLSSQAQLGMRAPDSASVADLCDLTP